MDMKRLFIADDTEGFRVLVRKVAESHDWGVTECENGRELLDALSESTDPGVIFMDLQMPELDGAETLMTLADRRDERQIYIVTGGPSTNASAAELMSKGKGLNVKDVLFKPIHLNRLTEILGTA